MTYSLQTFNTISNHIFNYFAELRKQPLRVLKVDGQPVELIEDPPHIQTAVFIIEFLFPSTAWSASPEIMALVQQTIHDLKEDLEVGKMEYAFTERYQRLSKLLNDLEDWLKVVTN